MALSTPHLELDLDQVKQGAVRSEADVSGLPNVAETKLYLWGLGVPTALCNISSYSVLLLLAVWHFLQLTKPSDCLVS
jgi:hypothetical protein